MHRRTESGTEMGESKLSESIPVQQWEAAAATYAAGGSLPPIPAPFLYNAKVLAWHDGDTGWFELDRGVYEYARWDVRLVGCNAIELAKPGGKEARDNLTALMPPGTPVVLATVKPDKYGGRLDAQVTYLNNGRPADLVTDLVAGGWAVLWNGVGTKPAPVWPRVAA